MKCTVAYMSGAGNLFTITNAAEVSPENATRLAPFLCDARATIGQRTDGLLIVAPDEQGITVHFFNPDGSTGMMCGNGARCAVRFALDSDIVPPSPTLRLNMAGTSYRALLDGDHITVIFPPPQTLTDPLTLTVSGHPLTCAYVDVGSDHVVISQHELEQWCAATGSPCAVTEVAPRIRWHSAFPRGCNVNLYHVHPDAVELTTYERGVEAITGACGTGALATAVVLWRRREYPAQTIPILPPSGRMLQVHIHTEGKTIAALALGGPAEFIAHATVELPLQG
ncbi:MAG: diaminopimelate epimerase [Candidatus Kapaibacterium sp.]|nr:MAG: diaminopimelate epimerase [Candidatus Kapabacteria bacterium]